MNNAKTYIIIFFIILLLSNVVHELTHVYQNNKYKDHFKFQDICFLGYSENKNDYSAVAWVTYNYINNTKMDFNKTHSEFQARLIEIIFIFLSLNVVYIYYKKRGGNNGFSKNGDSSK